MIASEEITHKSEMIYQLERRKRALELRQAQQGINTDPSVTTELQDIDKQIVELRNEINRPQPETNDLEASSASFDLSCSPLFWIVEIPVKLGIHIFGRIGK